MRILLVNPNTSEATTAAMLAVAREAAPDGMLVEGASAPFGSPLITDEAQLARSAEAVLALVRSGRAAAADGMIVAAFGDPGLAEVRPLLHRPVTGLAEAGMAEAAAGGRPFAVATTTPGLARVIEAAAHRYGHGALFRGVHLTPGDPVTLMADPPRLALALAEACRTAVRAGAEAVVIGGGPLAVAARAVAAEVPVPVIEPIPAAVRLAWRRGRA